MNQTTLRVKIVDQIFNTANLKTKVHVDFRLLNQHIPPKKTPPPPPKKPLPLAPTKIPPPPLKLPPQRLKLDVQKIKQNVPPPNEQVVQTNEVTKTILPCPNRQSSLQNLHTEQMESSTPLSPKVGDPSPLSSSKQDKRQKRKKSLMSFSTTHLSTLKEKSAKKETETPEISSLNVEKHNKTPKTERNSFVRKFFKMPKKSQNVDTLDISEPIGFKNVISAQSASSENLLSKFDSNGELPQIPLPRPLSLLNKKEVTSAQEYFSLVEEMKSKTLNFDDWSSPVVPKETWYTQHETLPLGWEKNSLVLPEVLSNGFCIEAGSGFTSLKTGLKEYYIVNITADFKFFNRFIKGNPLSIHFILKDEPVVFSVIPGQCDGFRRGMIISKRGIIRCLIPEEVNSLKQFHEAFPDNTKSSNILRVSDKPTFETEIAKFEDMMSVCSYKFGVLYCQSNQSNEDEMFRNTEGCPAYEKFLGLLAQKIELKGFPKFKGGLDVNNGETGTYSYFTEFLCYQIMFHVSTLLPDVKSDEQRVDKKRHLGNDVVVLVFKEKGETTEYFDPRCFTSHFTHVFVVVTPDVNDESNNGYTITVVCKSSVSPFPPFMKSSHFEHNEETRNFLLRKLINGGRMAEMAPSFETSMAKGRNDQLKMLLREVK
ncbi:rap GTPase-activating protein, putative [Entamoeba invadens IP1]|uniref:Rap GTPase-activating protein, putative n=1 Tax=Entamoeba invadens IP1 TaxID=370355 RepID=A0A0A1UFN3_ENTIV|nr:rap GTPase-activating protein, putative [Entamoeba invadens IP1]ELP92789.1 rap GTPase-activating protein, putative [Entamoeba invadens IP1]|eukprot:XP_004259560.1 rap GTPase-activating protein, putative [Entamoeba invadens IP1]